jgi:hypothetical protein
MRKSAVHQDPKDNRHLDCSAIEDEHVFQPERTSRYVTANAKLAAMRML